MQLFVNQYFISFDIKNLKHFSLLNLESGLVHHPSCPASIKPCLSVKTFPNYWKLSQFRLGEAESNTTIQDNSSLNKDTHLLLLHIHKSRMQSVWNFLWQEPRVFLLRCCIILEHMASISWSKITNHLYLSSQYFSQQKGERGERLFQTVKHNLLFISH